MLIALALQRACLFFRLTHIESPVANFDSHSLESAVGLGAPEIIVLGPFGEVQVEHTLALVRQVEQRIRLHSL